LVKKADESMASARSEIDAGRLTFAVNRLYYAVFYAVTAALTADGKKVSKHNFLWGLGRNFWVESELSFQSVTEL